jgi:hypothetical protein
MQDEFASRGKVFPRHDFAVAVCAIFIAREAGEIGCNFS